MYLQGLVGLVPAPVGQALPVAGNLRLSDMSAGFWFEVWCTAQKINRMAIACQAKSSIRPRQGSCVARPSLLQPSRPLRVLANPNRNGVGVTQEDVAPLVEEASAAAHGLFNPEFKVNARSIRCQVSPDARS
jgi:hypothetical protein